MTHPTLSLDEVVHQRVRLGILSILAEEQQADFSYLRTTLGLTDGNLSGHLRVLEDAGYVRIAKLFENRRPRTRVTRTASGLEAFDAELAALQKLFARLDFVELG
ncbi:MAG: helix-turn-helix domain-containing protein [Propionibacteriales bacterium]|nr:helix-turn-helix domain-containing protein [Propionibacteriales bacterium]